MSLQWLYGEREERDSQDDNWLADTRDGRVPTTNDDPGGYPERAEQVSDRSEQPEDDLFDAFDPEHLSPVVAMAPENVDKLHMRSSPARHAIMDSRAPALVDPFDSFSLGRRWQDGKPCSDCQTTVIWTTNYVDEKGSSTSCTTTSFATSTVTNLPPVTGTYWTTWQTTTVTLSAASAKTPSPPRPSLPPPQEVQGLDCDCEAAWLRYLLGGVPHGVLEVVACLAFFFPFAAYFVVTFLRLQRYAYDREMFFFLLPLLIFMCCMVAALPTRAFAATNDSSGHVLAQEVMLAVAVPILLEVALQLYGLLRKRAVPSGWIDASAIFLRIINAVALVLYAVAASELVTFITGWEHGTETCASTLPGRIAILNIVADFLEIIIVVLGMFLLFWVRWRLRLEAGPLVIQYLLYGLFLIHFLWRVMHDIAASNLWKHRLDITCSPIPAASSTKDTSASTFFFDYPWSEHYDAANHGTNSPAAWWLIGFLPIFLAATLLMVVNLYVYATYVPMPLAEPDSARYRLCYNEDTKKMEFQRIDNPGAPVLPSGEPLYEIIRDDTGDGWEIREARVSTVLGSWNNVTLRPWYR